MKSSNRKDLYHNILINRVAIILPLSISVLIALRLSAGQLHPAATFSGVTVISILLNTVSVNWSVYLY